MPRKLIAGNWKMNGLLEQGRSLAGDLAKRAGAAGGAETTGGLTCDFLICPPAQLLHPLAPLLDGSGIALGGQDCHAEASGAHTGDLGAAMLRDAGCSFVIVGHSERRQDHAESDALIAAKAQAAGAAGLIPIVCVGETEAERDAGRALAVIETQVRGSLDGISATDVGQGDEGQDDGLVVAYEPVWAIGTGKVAEPADVTEVHGQIRGILGDLYGAETAAGVRILYGGSVKPGNAGALMALENVDGALVGGASLKAEDFWAIGAACP